MKFHVYMIICSDSYLYTGITNDLSKRLREHSQGKCRLTKNRGMVKLAYKEPFESRIEAAARESVIKGWSRKKKERLVKVYTERSDVRE